MPQRQSKEVAPGITVDPAVKSGRPVIKGTRVPVAVILEQLSLAASFADLEREYGVSEDEIRAALAYAAGVIAGEPTPAR